jgi:hypothetical protein
MSDLTVGEVLGDVLKQEGMDRVTASHKEWYENAKTYAETYIACVPGIEMTGEEITQAVSRALGNPSPYIWGALTLSLIRGGYLKATGKRVKMLVPRSHARKTDVYMTCRPNTNT